MENVFLTSLTTPEVRQLFRDELETFFKTKELDFPSKTEAEKPITVKELCAFLRVTEATVIRWRGKGKIPFMQLGSRILFNKAEVLKALENKKGQVHAKR